jgi:hypothetical protein
MVAHVNSLSLLHWTQWTFLVGRVMYIFEICGLLGYYTASCGNYLPRRPQISSTSRRKPEIKVNVYFYLYLAMAERTFVSEGV